MDTVRSIAQRLRSGELSSRLLAERALELARDPAGEGPRTFVRLSAEAAVQSATDADRALARGSNSVLCGVPISVKDLCDVAGEVTTAGSIALAGSAAATRDATCIARLKQAGAVIVGRTNMTEFAFSGLGLNPHFGTPANPFDRKRRLIPGGSSSGAAVSVSDGMCVAAIGSDTGGSVRIPAALCGLVGFKPTQCRIPRDGIFPLSLTLDSIGTIARTVECCAVVDSLMAGEESAPIVPADLTSKRFAVPSNYFLDELDQQAASNFDAVLTRIVAAGARITSMTITEFNVLRDVAAAGGLAAPEAFAYHRRLRTDFATYDRRVAERILAGSSVSAATYLDILEERRQLIHTFQKNYAMYDALLCPTVPKAAPPMTELEQDPNLFRITNALFLRNPSVSNFLDTCSLNLPSQLLGETPTGLMLIGHHLADRSLLTIGKAIEAVLSA